MSDCGCGRSPTGKCVGWHTLTEEEYLEKKAAWETRQAEKDAKGSARHSNGLGVEKETDLRAALAALDLKTNSQICRAPPHPH